MNVTLYGRWEAVTAIPADTVASISAAIRPGDESVCVWVDEKNDHVLIASLDVDADDFETAIAVGQSALAEAAQLGQLSGRVMEVAAMTEDAHLTWTC